MFTLKGLWISIAKEALKALEKNISVVCAVLAVLWLAFYMSVGAGIWTDEPIPADTIGDVE